MSDVARKLKKYAIRYPPTMLTDVFTLLQNNFSTVERMIELIGDSDMYLMEHYELLLEEAITCKLLDVVKILLAVVAKNEFIRHMLDVNYNKTELTENLYIYVSTTVMLNCYRNWGITSEQILAEFLKYETGDTDHVLHNAITLRYKTESFDNSVIEMVLNLLKLNVRIAQVGSTVSCNDYELFVLFLDYVIDINEPFIIGDHNVHILCHVLSCIHSASSAHCMLDKLFNHPNLDTNGGYYYFKDNNCLNDYTPPIMFLECMKWYDTPKKYFFNRCTKYMEYSGISKQNLLDDIHKHEKVCVELICNTLQNKNMSALIYDYCS